MVHVKGIRSWLTQRFSSDLAGRVKYSTWWPSRRDSPSAARRAMPTRRGWSLSGRLSGSESRGREDIEFLLLFAYNRPAGWRSQEGIGVVSFGKNSAPPRNPTCVGQTYMKRIFCGQTSRVPIFVLPIFERRL